MVLITIALIIKADNDFLKFIIHIINACYRNPTIISYQSSLLVSRAENTGS